MARLDTRRAGSSPLWIKRLTVRGLSVRRRQTCGRVNRTPVLSMTVAFSGGGALMREESLYCPEFGKRHTNTCLAFVSSGGAVTTGFTVQW